MNDVDTDAAFEQMQFDYDAAASALLPVLQELARTVSLAQGFKTRSEERINEGITAMNEARALVPDAVEKLAVARGSAKVAAYSQPSAKAHGPQIVAAIKQIATWEKQLLKLDTAAGKMVESRFKLQDQLMDLGSRYAVWIKSMTQGLAELEPVLDGARRQLDTSLGNAQRHVAQRSEGGLQLDFADVNEVPLKKLADGVAKLTLLSQQAEKANAQISNETRKDLMGTFGRARSGLERLHTGVAYCIERKQATLALKVLPIDIAKALKTLGLPAAHKATLAKALVGDDAHCTKSLDDLSRQCNLPQSGKDMLALLRKASVL